MKRKYLKFLKNWSNEPKPKPLILRGARQVGKSTLVRIFAEENDFDLIEINFENEKLKSLTGINEENSFDFNRFIQEIELTKLKKIHKKTLIFLDEIQEIPIAISKLRYFFENEKRFLVICAGSLLEVLLEASNISMPVGRVEYLHISPMSFYEYLVAKDEAQLIEIFDGIDSIKNYRPFNVIHERFLNCFKEYLFVGGMPEAVKTYIETKDFEKVRRVHLSILNTYRDDLPKLTHRTKFAEYIKKAFDYSLANIGNENVKLSEIAETNSKNIRDALNLLKKAGIIHLAFHTNSQGLPLSAGINQKYFKIFFMDVGLFNAYRGLTFIDIFNLDGNVLLEKGKMIEQYVAQHLAFFQSEFVAPELYYWTNTESRGNAEIDFVTTINSEIYPIEVKAGVNTKMKSMWQFLYKTKHSTAIRFDLKYREELVEYLKVKVPIANNVMEEIRVSLFSVPVYLIEKCAHTLL